MRTTLENDVLCNRQQPGRAVNSFFDLGEFVAMKTLWSKEDEKCHFRNYTLLRLAVF